MSLKEVALDLRAGLSWRLGMSRPGNAPAGQLTVLTFHRVVPAPLLADYPFPELGVTPEELDACLAYAKLHYDIAPLSTQVARMRDGVECAQPLMSITFDDGQWDNAAYGTGVLQKNDIKATFYVPVEPVESGEPLWHDIIGYFVQRQRQSRQPGGSLAARFLDNGVLLESRSPGQVCESLKQLDGRTRAELVSVARQEIGPAIPRWSRMMTWADVVGLHQRGHEIGSHSLSHDLLPKQTREQIQLEIHGSKTRIEGVLQSEVRSFCYPNGSQDVRERAEVQKAGYENAVTTRHGSNSLRQDVFGLDRIHMESRYIKSRSGRFSRERMAFRLRARPHV